MSTPHEYALIYGSLVPGYRAPTDTVAAATRAVTVLGKILQDGVTSGALPRHVPGILPLPVVTDVTRISDVICPDVSPVSFELFGQLNNTIEDRKTFFGYQMSAQAVYVGLPSDKKNVTP